jgi:hypothetical protein
MLQRCNFFFIFRKEGDGNLLATVAFFIFFVVFILTIIGGFLFMVRGCNG